MNKTIYIRKYMPSTIATRKAISYFEEDMKLKSNTSYVFDFADILFISRSFADELLKYLNSKNIEFELKNANSNITEILKAVQKNSARKSLSPHEIAITSFDSKKELVQFLSAI